MQQKTIAETISSFCNDFSVDSAEKEIVHATKRFILDNVGCILGGKIEKSSDIIANIVKKKQGVPESSVIGYGFKTSLVDAALANGTIGHAIELDDDHREGTQHPGVQVIPTALAVGESLGSSGNEIISAVITGCEIAIRVGEAYLGDLYYQGFHPTGVCGVFGSAIAAGKLLNLDDTQMVNALGIAGSQASGLREWKVSGAWSKRYQAGHANWAGTMAALMAKEGFTGPATIFEGEYGVLRAYSYQLHYDESKITKNLGSKYEMIDTSIKPHACCRFAQPIVDCTLALVYKYDLRPEDVRSVKVGTGKNTLIALTKPAERKYRPKTRVDAQFSLPYSVAVSIHHRQALVDEFSENCFRNSSILETVDKVKAYLDEEVESKWPQYYPAVVTIETFNGRELVEKIDYPKGDPENPVTDEELEAKFRTLASLTLKPDKVEEIIGIIKDLDKLENVQKLMENL